MKTKILTVDPIFPEVDRVTQCAKIIRQGGLVIFPTETVYGIAADYANPKAIKRLREVKKRSDDKPFAILIARKEFVDLLSDSVDIAVYKLIDEFWPGPLTIVMSGKEPGQTVGIRMPNNLIALNFIYQAQCVIAAPSANFEGNPPPLTCEEALKDLDGLVDIAMDGGPVAVGQSSTVVDLTAPERKILRPGPITPEEIEQVIKQKVVLFVCTGNSCRSVMAEYLMKRMLGARQDVQVISAGTGAYVTMGASPETLEVLRKEGINATMHRSQPINRTMLKKADLILVMTQTHRRQILDLCPTVEKRVYLLKEFAKVTPGMGISLDISDPIGKPKEVYEECIMTIKEIIEKVVELV